jgi:hypothetical protein
MLHGACSVRGARSGQRRSNDHNRVSATTDESCDVQEGYGRPQR